MAAVDQIKMDALDTLKVDAMEDQSLLNCSDYTSSANFVEVYGVNCTWCTNETMQETYSYVLPWWKQLIWTLLYAAMIVVATGGNLIVIWIVLAHKRMRTVTNYLLVNLSIADTMVSTLNVTFTYTYMLYNDWPFGRIYCKISEFVAVLSICASVFTLMAIAIDRYMAIMNPLRPRMGRRTTLCIAGFIWVVGFLLSLPMLMFYTTEESDSRTVCYAEWPDGPSTQSDQEYIYNVIFMIFTYFLPIGAMGYAYARVGKELWGSQSIGECTQRQLDNIRSKRRVVKMMIVVVTIFAVCWLPFHVYFIITSQVPEIVNYEHIQEVYLAIYWLAMSNSMYNPIIYCWMNSRFRRGFKKVFRWCPCITLDRGDALDPTKIGTTRYSCSGSPETQCRIIRNGSTIHIPLQYLQNDYRDDSGYGGSQYSSVRGPAGRGKWRSPDGGHFT